MAEFSVIGKHAALVLGLISPPLSAAVPKRKRSVRAR
jgi:hypothetical protein